MSKKIVVLQRKEILTTALFAAIGILVLILLVLFFTYGKRKNPDASPTASISTTYKAGIYTSVFALGDHMLSMEVTVDPEHINSVRLINLDESITTMYPLMEPALASISKQVCEEETPLAFVKLSEDSKYTQMLLLRALETTLEKARFQKE